MLFTTPKRCKEELSLPDVFLELHTDLTVWLNGKKIGEVSEYVRIKQAS